MRIKIIRFDRSLQISYTDLAPNYVGTLFGIGNSVSCICGFAAPFVTGVITQEEVRDQGRQPKFLLMVAFFIYVEHS